MSSIHFHHVQHSLLKILLLITLVIRPSESVFPDFPTLQIILKICDRTPNPVLCQTLIQQNLPNPSSDARNLVELSIRMVLSSVTNTLRAVKQAKSTATKNVADLLTICEEGYNVVLNEYEEASLAISKNDVRSARPINDCIENVNSVVPQLQALNTRNVVLQGISVACSEVYSTSQGV